ncbi:hypothetical protein [Fibrobacter sp.]|uniref:hypothetical protein n=1 Tax=Fibrobacter sp. TaxID=35828 RepID=UPI00388E2930
MFVMKKVLMIIVFFSTMLFSAEFENPQTNLRFGTELWFVNDYLTFQFGNACSNSFVNCIKDTSSSYEGFNGLAYYSTIDTTIVVFVSTEHVNKITIFSIYPFSLSSPMGTNLKDVLRTEFMHLQEWGVLNISKDSASILIDKIIFDMLGGKCDWDSISDSNYVNTTRDFSNLGSYRYDAICDTLYDCCGEPVDGGTAIIDNWWTLLPDEKPTSVSKTPIKNRFRLSRMNHETFFVEGINEATPYKVFDVNGILLKQGLVQNGVVQVPKTPSILDIAHQKFLLK